MAPAPIVPVHPRVCGELAAGGEPADDVAGSSPRVRGTPAAAGPDLAAHRFIPACAGNSYAVHRGQSPGASVHPRVCGELRMHLDQDVASAGSSPRVRGTLLVGASRLETSRFIPACAGNSALHYQRSLKSAVHPRVCGELSFGICKPNALTGSSPRVRGTQRQPVAAGARVRFIPACAGNSTTVARPCAAIAVHPRVCGELLAQDRRQPTRLRFIPACAGNSPPPCSAPAPKTVHPRVCGELSAASATSSAVEAVHPRVCGELAPGATRRP